MANDVKKEKDNIKKFQKAIKKLESKEVKTEDDMSELNILYNQLFDWRDYLDSITKRDEEELD